MSGERELNVNVVVDEAKDRADKIRKELTFSFKNLWNPEDEDEMHHGFVKPIKRR